MQGNRGLTKLPESLGYLSEAIRFSVNLERIVAFIYGSRTAKTVQKLLPATLMANEGIFLELN